MHVRFERSLCAHWGSGGIASAHVQAVAQCALSRAVHSAASAATTGKLRVSHTHRWGPSVDVPVRVCMCACVQASSSSLAASPLPEMFVRCPVMDECVSERKFLESRVKHITIQGRPTNRTVGQKSRFFDYDNDMCSV